MRLTHYILHLFVPHYTNNHRAKLLHNSSIFVLCLSLIFAQLILVGFSRLSNKPAVLGYAAQISVSEVITLTNQKRAEAGLQPLKQNPSLDQGAIAKGQNMLAVGYWAHVAPDGTQPWKYFGDVGYKYRFAGENLARDFSSASSAVEAWMASPTHRDNLLSDKYTEIGIGVVEGDLNGVDTTIVVQFFGRPMTEAIAEIEQPVQTTVVPAIAQISATPSPAPSVAPLEVLANTNPQARENTVLISPFVTTKNLSIALVLVLLAAFVIDVVVVSKRRISRISGRSVAHIGFLGITLAIMLIIQAGKIL